MPRFQNQLAAMPSLHFGYSFVIGMSLFFFSPHKWLSRVAPAYPALILLVIVSTGNHYIADSIAGFFVACLAWRINNVLLNLRPLEEWGFWLCRTEKPMDVSATSEPRRGNRHLNADVRCRKRCSSVPRDSSRRRTCRSPRPSVGARTRASSSRSRVPSERSPAHKHACTSTYCIL
jgi:hypothetical protein